MSADVTEHLQRCSACGNWCSRYLNICPTCDAAEEIPRCCCPSHDASECVELRLNLSARLAENWEPCVCPCHEGADMEQP